MAEVPTTQRVSWIIEHMISLGAYTQAKEVALLDEERNRLKALLIATEAKLLAIAQELKHA